MPTNIFTQIESAFMKQNDDNASFHQRIGQLEITTQNIDGKLDLLLEKYDVSSSHKMPRTSDNMQAETGNPPFASLQPLSLGYLTNDKKNEQKHKNDAQWRR
jgi:hypothetical protein